MCNVCVWSQFFTSKVRKTIEDTTKTQKEKKRLLLVNSRKVEKENFWKIV